MTRQQHIEVAIHVLAATCCGLGVWLVVDLDQSIFGGALIAINAAILIRDSVRTGIRDAGYGK